MVNAAHATKRFLSQAVDSVSNPRLTRLLVAPIGLFTGIGGGRTMDMHDFDPEFPRDPGQDWPPIDPNRPPTSWFYTVTYETQLTKEVDFPGQSRRYHFAEANRNLYYDMLNDPQFAAKMEAVYPGISSHVAPNAFGEFLRESPSMLGLTWHHTPSGLYVAEGIMQLVSRLHHISRGNVQQSLHPFNGGGGFDQWGG